jgi:GT2 family glycosyltransferase
MAEISVANRILTDAEGAELAVVVCSFRRHEEIVHCLEDLANQRTDVRFEVVLVLQEYPDGAAEALDERFGQRLDLRIYCFERGLGVHGARNAAIARTRAPIIAFIDDDVRLGPSWVSTLLPFYDNPSIGGVGGFVRHPGCDTLARRIIRPLFGLSSRRYRIDWGGFNSMPYSAHPVEDQDADWLSGCNMSYRREALVQVGGFDESFGSYGYDDVDIGLRVRRAGFKLVSTRRLEIAHFPSSVNRASLPDTARAEEAKRLKFVVRAIGDRRFWRLRFWTRFLWHLSALSVQAVVRREPLLVPSALLGAREGMRALSRERRSVRRTASGELESQSL